MVKQLILLLIFSVLCTLNAQSQIVEWSNQQKLKSKTNFTKIIGENATGLYLIRGKNGELNRDIIIEKYKSNLALETSAEIEQPVNSDIEEILLMDDGLLLFAFRRNDSLPMLDLICWKLNSQLQRNGSIRQIAQIDQAFFNNNTTLYIQPSVAKKNYTVVYFTEGLEKKTSNINILGFDEGLNRIFTKSVARRNSADDAVVSGVECDNEGNAFLLIDYPTPVAEKTKKSAERDFYLYSYYKELDKVLEYVIQHDSAFINDIGLVLNNYKKTVVVAGLYSTEAGNTIASGTFVYSIDIPSTLIQYSFYEPLNKSFITKLITSMLNETGPNITDLYIRKLIPRSDGGISIITEKYYETRQTYTYYANGFPQTASKITYHHDEIIVISKNNEGKTQFNEVIKKTQSSMNDAGYYSSFVLLNTNNKLSFIYNSNSNNDGDIMISSINPLGLIETKILIKALSYYVQLMPLESKQINANTSLICTLKDRRFTLMKLTY
jgi:hypothetical protein